MALQFNPVAGAASYRVSNPCVISIMALLGSLQVFAQTDMVSLRSKSNLLTSYLEYLLTHSHTPSSKPLSDYIQIITPTSSHERGCQLSIVFKQPEWMMVVFHRLCQQGVIVDERKPDVIRIAPTPLYNTFQDVFDCVEKMSRILDEIQ